MKQILGLLFSLCLVNAVLAQEPKEEPSTGVREAEAVEIVKKADTATKVVKFVKYTADIDATQYFEPRVPKMKGTAIMAGESPRGLDKFHFTVNVKRQTDSEGSDYVVGSDGTNYYLIHMKEKSVHVGSDPSVVGRTGALILTYFPMGEYSHPTPFGQEGEGDTVQLLQTDKIGDEECYKIHVNYAGQTGSERHEAIWYFSKNDYLPRRVERIRKMRGRDTGRYTVTLSNLVVDPEIEGDPFALVVPDGFSQSSDPAPK